MISTLVWRRVRRVLSTLVLGGAVAGCTPAETLKPVFPARGQVFFEGKPAAGMLVVLRPLGDPVPNALDPRAIVASDGSFVVSTHNARDGAPPGKYAVTVHGLNAGDTEAGGPPTAPGAIRLPPRYASPASSGLEVQVIEGENTFPPFRLSR